MPNVVVDKNKIDLLANAIADKSGEPVTMTLDEMVEAVDGIESGITPTGNIDITHAGVTDVANYATATVPQANPWVGYANNGFITENNQRKWHIRPFVEFSEGEQVGWMDTDKFGQYITYNAIPTGTSVTPTESSQTIGGANTMMEGAVTVNAIPSNYVGSGITRRDVYDLTASGSTVTVPSGYYTNGAQKSVGTGTAKPAASISASAATVSVGTNTITLSKTAVSNTPQVTAGYISSGTAGDTDVSLTASVNTRSSSDLTVSGAQITAPAGYYASSASKSVPTASFTGPEIVLQTGATISTVPSSGTLILKKLNVNMDVTSTGGYVGNNVNVTAAQIQLRADCAINPTLTASGATVTAPAGYYSSAATKSVDTMTLPTEMSNTSSASRLVAFTLPDANGKNKLTIPAGYNSTARYYQFDVTGGSATPAASISGSSATVEANGIYNTLTLTKTISNTPQVTAGYISSGTSGNTEVSLTADIPIRTSLSGLNGVDEYVVIANNGYYPTTTSHSIPHGTAGTPTATKGTVSNHSVSVTPSVTNTTGYITGSTINGTAVTVSASELVSGTYTVSSSGSADITNYASLSVPNGSATPQSGISGLQATLSTGTNTLTLTQTIENTPAVTPGYISSGTTGNTILSLTASVNTRSSSDLTASNLTVTAPSGYYASNATKTLTDANLLATNIKKDVSIFGVTGTYEGSGIGGSDAHFGYVENTPDSANVLAFQLDGQPTSCFVYVKSSLTPISDVSQVSAIVWDGGDYIGDHYVQTITNTANAQVSYVNGGVYHSISGDSPITITFYAGMGDDIAFADETYVCIYSYGTTSSVDTKTQSVGSGATSITFTGLTKTPQYFACIFTSNFSTSNGYQRVIAVGECDGDCYGLEMDSSAHYSNAHWSYSYSNGSLTITSQGTNAGGYFHQPGNYLLVYSYDNDTSFQTKTVTPTTSQQIIEADTGYLGLSSVTVNAIPSSYVQPTTTVGSTTYRASTTAQTITSGTYHSAAATIAAVTQTNLTAANIKSGTTITISNGQSNLWSVTGTYEGEGGGGTTAHVGTSTITNSSASNTSISFSSLSGTPKAFFVRCTSQLTRSSNSSYYYVTFVRYNGTNTTGNYWRMSNGTFYNDTSHYSYTYSNGTLTVHSSASRSSAGGSFYNGGYELVYVYES